MLMISGATPEACPAFVSVAEGMHVPFINWKTPNALPIDGGMGQFQVCLFLSCCFYKCKGNRFAEDSRGERDKIEFTVCFFQSFIDSTPCCIYSRNGFTYSPAFRFFTTNNTFVLSSAAVIINQALGERSTANIGSNSWFDTRLEMGQHHLHPRRRQWSEYIYYTIFVSFKFYNFVIKKATLWNKVWTYNLY